MLRKAIDGLSEISIVNKISGVYETQAWGNTTQADYLNLAMLVQTKTGAADFMLQLLSLEQKLGRIRNEKWEPRIIDIDILFFNSEIIDTSTLKVPHPFLQERKFVLAPLNEICPGLFHPILNKRVATLLEKCSDNLQVKKLSETIFSNHHSTSISKP